MISDIQHQLTVFINQPWITAFSPVHCEALYPNFGYLYPEGTKELRKVFNDTTVRAALEPYSKYLQLFDQVSLSWVQEIGRGTSLHRLFGLRMHESLIRVIRMRREVFLTLMGIVMSCHLKEIQPESSAMDDFYLFFIACFFIAQLLPGSGEGLLRRWDRWANRADVLPIDRGFDLRRSLASWKWDEVMTVMDW